MPIAFRARQEIEMFDISHWLSAGEAALVALQRAGLRVFADEGAFIEWPE